MEYPLTFIDAMKVLEKCEGWVQGERFRQGIVLKDGLVCVQVHDLKTKHTRDLTITYNILGQHFRIIKTEQEAY